MTIAVKLPRFQIDLTCPRRDWRGDAVCDRNETRVACACALGGARGAKVATTRGRNCVGLPVIVFSDRCFARLIRFVNSRSRGRERVTRVTRAWPPLLWILTRVQPRVTARRGVVIVYRKVESPIGRVQTEKERLRESERAREHRRKENASSNVSRTRRLDILGDGEKERERDT